MIRAVQDKIQKALEREQLDCVLAAGVDNITYLSGCVLPFAEGYPNRRAYLLLARSGKRTMVCPYDWEEPLQAQGWDGEVIACADGYKNGSNPAAQVLARAINRYAHSPARIGLDMDRVPSRLLEKMTALLPSANWQPADRALSDLRQVKTPEEIALIAEACKQSDQGIVGALFHLEGTVDTLGYTVGEFTERVRVHIIEAGGSGIGHMATLEGHEDACYVPQRGLLKGGNLLRIDVHNHQKGYWSNAGRMVTLGEPSLEQARAYSENLALKKKAVGLLSAGVRSCEIYRTVARYAEETGLTLRGTVVGHGVGVAPREGPFLSLEDGTVLERGMVVVLTIVTHSPEGELICSKDTYELAEEGCRLLSRYRNWDQLYLVYGYRATH